LQKLLLYLANFTTAMQQLLQQIINNKTKPLGALGKLEKLALQIGNIQNTTAPTITNAHIIVFAADHGIAATGLVNPYPQAVTAQMVLNFLQGGAAINVFTKQHNIALQVVDCGVNYSFQKKIYNQQFINKKIGLGTADYSKEKAMPIADVEKAIKNGRTIIKNLPATCNTVGFGEMGISNTSSAALIMHAITKLPIEKCVGKGTGSNASQLQTKLKTLKKVASFQHLKQKNITPQNILSCVGGFEIATMVGAYLQAAESNIVIVVDGFICTAALLLAQAINPTVIQNCVFAHTSGEKGHAAMLTYLKAKPLLNLGMRLGEGTGAALAIPLLQSAALFVQEMASFNTAGVSTATT
jgi:nicotinate-nucleotide--dimethylbenzimidazole phosphoribosyltransferase